MLELVAEAHARQLGGVHGFSTDIELLRCTQNVTKAEARRRIIAARDVLPGLTVTGEALPAVLLTTAEAVAEDAISLDHVAVIERVLAGLAPHLEIHRTELESYLARADQPVLLCGHHHTVLHRGEWTVTIVDDHPLFHPPPWIPGGPRRNTVHRIDLAASG